ncbi:MAG: hypothetical protein AAFN81_23935 [Bacteroidota bacterium]
MKKLSFWLGLLLPLIGWSQDDAEATPPSDTLEIQTAAVAENTDSIQWTILERDPEIDALVAYYKKLDPPIITFHRGNFGRTWWNPWGGHTYYKINGQRITRGGVQEYLGEVAPLAYKDFTRGQQIRRGGKRWLLIGMGGYLLTLASSDQSVRRVGLGAFIVGGSLSLGSVIAGNIRQRRGINYYNSGF